MSYLNKKEDFFLRINKDGYLYETNSFFEGYLLPDELFMLKEAIDKTIDLYNSNQITEEWIRNYSRKKSDEREKEQEEYLKQQRIQAKLNKSKPKEVFGDLYLIHDIGSNALKIGITTNIEARLSQLQTSNCNPLSILFLISDKAHLEKSIHLKFNHFRLLANREWFKYDESIISHFKELSL